MADQVVDQDMETRELPKFIQFNEGDFVEGIIIGIESCLVKGKKCTRYTVHPKEGLDVSFIGTNQLDRKLRVNDLGHFAKIYCKGEDPNVQKGDNRMKLFDVKVSKHVIEGAPLLPVQNQVNPEITEEDIPF
jgi:hypothetical protein